MLYTTKVIGVKPIAKYTYELAIERPNNYAFRAGQYTQVQVLDLVHSDAKGNSRQFSIASAPAETAALRFVFRQSGSGFKETLVKSRSGDAVVIEAAAGSFLLPSVDAVSHVFVAGGVGIAPFMSVLQHMVMQGQSGIFTLVYGNQAPEYAAYLPFLKSLKSINRNFTLQEIYKKPTPELFAKLAEKRQEAVWWVVGPPPMVATAVHGLRSVGVHPNQIRSESFTGY